MIAVEQPAQEPLQAETVATVRTRTVLPLQQREHNVQIIPTFFHSLGDVHKLIVLSVLGILSPLPPPSEIFPYHPSYQLSEIVYLFKIINFLIDSQSTLTLIIS